MAVTIDPRPSVFGDRMILTGSYEAADATIDLSAFFSSIDFAGVNSSGASAAVPITDTGAVPPSQDVYFQPIVRIDGTSLRIAAGLADQAAEAGTFFAIGRRA
jgi:hypothetical protein